MSHGRNHRDHKVGRPPGPQNPNSKPAAREVLTCFVVVFMSFHVFSCVFHMFFFLCLAFLWLASKLSCYEFQKASRVHKSAVPKRSQKSNSSANHRDQRQIFPPPPAPEPRKSRSGPNLGFRPRLPGMTMENGEKLRKKNSSST